MSLKQEEYLFVFLFLFQEKLDKWESKIESNRLLEEYKLASDKQNEKVIMENMNKIIQEDMNSNKG